MCRQSSTFIMLPCSSNIRGITRISYMIIRYKTPIHCTYALAIQLYTDAYIIHVKSKIFVYLLLISDFVLCLYLAERLEDIRLGTFSSTLCSIKHLLNYLLSFPTLQLCLQIEYNIRSTFNSRDATLDELPTPNGINVKYTYKITYFNVLL